MGWLILLMGALIAGALSFLLLFRLPSTSVQHEAGALASAVARLGWPHPENADELNDDFGARGKAVDLALARLEAGSVSAAVELPALRSFSANWAALRQTRPGAAPAGPDTAALRALADGADAMAASTRQQIDERNERLESWLKVLALLLAATLLLPLHGLWRQRQRVRASLHAFSSHLGSGDWQDAVQTLRDERLGPPSAFDALATGVEGVMVETERRWQALADLSADWYWETDGLHRISRLSGSSPPAIRQGWTMPDLLGRRRDELPFFEPPAHGWPRFHEKLERREAFRDLEYRITPRHAGEPTWVSISGRPRHDVFGDFVGYEGVGRDVTERKDAHERLIASEQRWSLMAGLASDWYWQTDAEHRMLPLSPELYRRFSALADRLEGRPRWEAHRDLLSAEQWAQHRADLDARRPFRSLQMEIEATEGGYIWISISGIPRFDSQGRFLGYHGVGRDVTVRKQSERLLQRHNEELKRAVALRTRDLERLNLDLDAFSRQLAHELRTPIGHVQGLAHLIEARAGDRLTSEERQLLDLQVSAARSMRDTVDALLQLARSTVQEMPMERVDISALAAAVVADMPPLRRKAAIDWSLAPGLRAWASPAALRIVLTNLLGNAAKFTRKVSLPAVSLTGGIGDDGRLRISVQDNGAGFDPALASRLFMPFGRLHGGDDFHGTGIGLTIVQRIVERHGGSVSAHGESGRGARFEFTLAAEKPAVPQA